MQRVQVKSKRGNYHVVIFGLIASLHNNTITYDNLIIYIIISHENKMKFSVIRLL